MARHDSILDTIGHTPTVRLSRLAPAGVNVHVKLEAFNPMGSVKDRMALAVIEQAERSGALHPGQTVIEATSGNTGIGLAMVCARKGYPLVVTMAENFSLERRRLLRFLGARVVLTPAAEKGSGMLAKAVELRSPLTQQAVTAGLVDEVVPVTGEAALRLARELARQEGIFAEISAGAILAAALEVARRAPAGSHIVCMLPDTGERYQSTPLFDGIADEMNAEELTLSRSTPSYRFDRSAPVPTPPVAAFGVQAADPEAERFVDACLAESPVVMFGLV